jgi:hypothetical protein
MRFREAKGAVSKSRLNDVLLSEVFTLTSRDRASKPVRSLRCDVSVNTSLSSTLSLRGLLLFLVRKTTYPEGFENRWDTISLSPSE